MIVLPDDLKEVMDLIDGDDCSDLNHLIDLVFLCFLCHLSDWNGLSDVDHLPGEGLAFSVALLLYSGCSPSQGIWSVMLPLNTQAGGRAGGRVLLLYTGRGGGGGRGGGVEMLLFCSGGLVSVLVYIGHGVVLMVLCKERGLLMTLLVFTGPCASDAVVFVCGWV